MNSRFRMSLPYCLSASEYGIIDRMNSPNSVTDISPEKLIADASAAILSLHAVLPEIKAAVALLASTLENGGKVLAAGNGGSAAEAMHLAEELSGRYKHNRRALPALALCADGTALTCIGNDFGFDKVFSRQVEAFGGTGDLLVLFSSSGNSANLREAITQARAKGLNVLSLLGHGGGAIHGLSDVEITLPETASAHVQEAHQVVLHILLEHIDATFVP
jgi:D-sedoheptulose 7-phosphate isomerase